MRRKSTSLLYRRRSTEEVRQLAKHQLIHFEVSRPWLELSDYSFYDSPNLAMVELELNIEILNMLKDPLHAAATLLSTARIGQYSRPDSARYPLSPSY